MADSNENLTETKAAPSIHSSDPGRPSQRLIGICGAIGSGKDSVAHHLVERHGFTRVGLADALKNSTAEMFGIPSIHFFGTQKQKAAPIEKLGPVTSHFGRYGGIWPYRVGKPWSGRWLTEFIGTEVGRAVYPDIWINKVIHRVTSDIARCVMTPDADCYRHVIPDVRFLNEAAAIREAGGEVWRVAKLRLNVDETEIVDVEPESTGHVSDQEYKQIQPDKLGSAFIGDLESLGIRVDELMEDSSE